MKYSKKTIGLALKYILPSVLLTSIIFFVIGYQIGFDVATEPQIEPAYSAAQYAAIKQCMQNGIGGETCRNMRTMSIQDVPCKDSAPQNGGVNSCGYWSISFVDDSAPGVSKIYNVSVNYSAHVFNIYSGGSMSK